VFCDTQIIIREIERRFPSPTLFPAGAAGAPWALSSWTDRAFFQNAVTLVFGTLGPKVAQAFVEDRSQLRGAKFDLDKMRAAIPQMRDQLRAQLGWIEAQLGDGRQWVLGDFSLNVSSRALMGHPCRVIRRMRYGTGSSRERHDDRGGPSSDTT
jgi:glutathione S-transferase